MCYWYCVSILLLLSLLSCFFNFLFFSLVLEVINEWMERYWEEDWSGNSLLLEILSSFAHVVEV